MTSLRRYISALQQLCQPSASPGAPRFDEIAQALRNLLATDDWLPDAYARPHPQFYQQYPLYIDGEGRFSVVSFVWGPGQFTPLHDHQTWGVVGVLRGAECSQGFRRLAYGLEPDGPECRLEPGGVEIIRHGNDVHRVRNALDDQVSISIHTYGSDIGQQARHTFDPADGTSRPFVSGYALPPLLPDN